MTNKKIIDLTIRKIENILQDLKQLSSQEAQEEQFESVLMSKLNEIEAQTSEIKRGVIG